MLVPLHTGFSLPLHHLLFPMFIPYSPSSKFTYCLQEPTLEKKKKSLLNTELWFSCPWYKVCQFMPLEVSPSLNKRADQTELFLFPCCSWLIFFCASEAFKRFPTPDPKSAKNDWVQNKIFLSSRGELEVTGWGRNWGSGALQQDFPWPTVSHKLLFCPPGIKPRPSFGRLALGWSCFCCCC